MALGQGICLLTDMDCLFCRISIKKDRPILVAIHFF